jgi:predicted P-loop ATPase
MSAVDDLINTHPLFELKDKLLSITGKMERLQYLGDPKWGVIRALAQLHELQGGIRSYQYLLEQINEAVKGVKGWIDKSVKAEIINLRNEDLSSDVTPGADPKDLDKDSKGNVTGTHKNIKWFLKYKNTFAGLFGYDTFTKRIWLKRDPPWGYHNDIPDILKKPFGYKPLIGNEIFNICALLNDDIPTVIQEHIVKGAIDDLSREHSFDYLIEYIESLPEWDKTSRLFTFAERHCHLERIDLLAGEIQLINKMFGKFVISMMARCFDPGCVAKGMLCLRGAQHIGKSGLLRELFYPFAREHSGKSIDMGDPDLFHKLTSAWGIELGELAGVYGREIETVKNFISTVVDIFRRKFHREESEIPRRYVIATTYNPGDTDPLNDTTGNVRKWLIPLGNEEYEIMDFVSIKEEMEQIKAEALYRYRNGESWELDDPEDQRIHTELLAKALGDVPSAYWVQIYINKHNDLIKKEGFHIEQMKLYLNANYPGSPGAKLGPRELNHALTACGMESDRVYTTSTKMQEKIWFFKGDKNNVRDYWRKVRDGVVKSDRDRENF